MYASLKEAVSITKMDYNTLLSIHMWTMTHTKKKILFLSIYVSSQYILSSLQYATVRFFLVDNASTE